MQDVLGADSTDLNWSAQPSSNCLATNTGLDTVFCISFPPLIHAIAHRADALDGSSRVRRSRRFLARGCPLLHAAARRLEIALSRRTMVRAFVSGEAARCRVLRDRRVVSRPVSPCARREMRAIAVGEI